MEYYIAVNKKIKHSSSIWMNFLNVFVNLKMKKIKNCTEWKKLHKITYSISKTAKIFS